MGRGPGCLTIEDGLDLNGPVQIRNSDLKFVGWIHRWEALGLPHRQRPWLGCRPEGDCSGGGEALERVRGVAIADGVGPSVKRVDEVEMNLAVNVFAGCPFRVVLSA